MTQQKIRMLAINDIEDCALSVIEGQEVAGLPISNVQLDNNSRSFRSMSVNKTIVKGVFNQFKVITSFILWRHNLSNAGTVRLEFYTDDACLNKVHDTGRIPVAPPKTLGDWQWQIEPVASSVFDDWEYRLTQIWLQYSGFVKAFKLIIEDPQNTDGYKDIVRIYAGRTLSPTINFSNQHDFGFDTQSEQHRTDGGTLHSPAAPVYRKVNFSFAHINEVDRAHISNAIRHVNKSRDWFVSLFPELSTQKEFEYAFACKFTQIPTIKSITYNLYHSEFAVEEC
ncbi:MAG: hypothetical protein VX100_07475 [Pseudomonadota bacterium]|nr:hypothetical protein [Pseudomonadota bacterium]